MKEGGGNISPIIDNRQEAIAQRKLQAMANDRLPLKQLKAYKEMANKTSQAKPSDQLKARDDKNSSQQQQPIQPCQTQDDPKTESQADILPQLRPDPT